MLLTGYSTHSRDTGHVERAKRHHGLGIKDYISEYLGILDVHLRGLEMEVSCDMMPNIEYKILGGESTHNLLLTLHARLYRRDVPLRVCIIDVVYLVLPYNCQLLLRGELPRPKAVPRCLARHGEGKA